MSGGGGSTNTIQNATPWSGVQPALSTLYGALTGTANTGTTAGDINGAWQNGQLAPNLNTGQVSPLTPGQTSALQGMQALGGAGFQQENQALNQMANLAVGNMGMSPGGTVLQGLATGNNPAVANLLNTANGGGTAMQSLGGLANGSAGVDQLLGNFANGGMLNTANDAAQSLYKAESQPIMQQFNTTTLPALLSAYSSAGRMGSGANDTALNNATLGLGTSLGNLAQSTIGSNYEQQVANMLSAQGTLGNLRANAASSLGQIGNQAGSAAGSLMGSAGNNLANLQGSAISNLGSMGNGLLQQGLTSGNQLQAFYQQLLNAQIAQGNYNASQPMIGLQNLSGLLTGAAGLGGTTSSSGNTANNANPASIALGTGMLGSSLYNAGAFGSLLGGGTAAAGAGIGAGAFSVPAALLASAPEAAGGTSALMGLGAMGAMAL